MAHFLLFIPKDHHPPDDMRTEAILDHVGLADFTAGAATVQTTGPDGKGGTLFGWSKGATARLHFKPEEQEWIPAVADGDLPAGRYWVGLWKNSPPTEADLRRPYRYGGRSVVLAEQEWIIPTPEQLPHTAKVADDGSWRFVLQRAFADYGVECDRWLEKVGGPEGGNVTFLDMLAFSVRALGLNYRLTPEVVSHLELFTQESAGRVFATALGLQLAE